MNQYDLPYQEFTFLGTLSDFDDKSGADICVSEDLCKIDLNKLWNNGIRMIGVVFNLDPLQIRFSLGFFIYKFKKLWYLLF